MTLAPLGAAAVVLLPPSLAAQAWLRLAGQALVVYTHQDPIPGGGRLAEARVVQPVAMLQAGAGRFTFTLTADGEGLTIPHGELNLGAWGEGYMDRRHPHTYLHELVAAAQLGVLSLAAGKGFVPFGTDDPMSRPVERYPVNHHLAQILERALVAAGVRGGPVQLELGLFNGDEPTRPGDWPVLRHVGDSWAGRLTLARSGIEWQGSLAHLHSPEDRGGAGVDQDKWSTSVRVERGRMRVLAELARTSEADGFFVFHSQLIEAALTAGRSAPYARIERTERPEEERAIDPFRAVRPLLENATVGTTRWTIFTAGYGYDAEVRTGLHVAPFVELSYTRITKVGGGLFDPAALYGRTDGWTVSAGVGARWHMAGHRMGRYLDRAAAMPGMDMHGPM